MTEIPEGAILNPYERFITEGQIMKDTLEETETEGGRKKLRFYLMRYKVDFKGEIYSQKYSCSLLGEYAERKKLNLKEGDNILIEGVIRGCSNNVISVKVDNVVHRQPIIKK